MSETPTQQIQVVEALVVNPGDHLLVSIKDPEGMTKADVERLRDVMRERFPGVEVTLLAGASVAVQRPEPVQEPVPVRDERPHSRACGWRPHDHGPACTPNCPTCGGKAMYPVATS